MNKYQFTPNPQKAVIKTLSPIFIGTGVSIDRTETAAKGDIYYRTTLEKLYETYPKKEIEPLIMRQIERPTEPIMALKEKVMAVPIYKMKSSETTIDMGLEFHEYIKSNGKMYIPGSSIKGAIFTALINEAMVKVAEESDQFYEYLKINLARALSNKKLASKVGNKLIQVGLLWLTDPDKLSNIRNFEDKSNFKDVQKAWIQVSDTEGIKPEKAGVLRRVGRLKVYESGTVKTKRARDINMEMLRNGIEFAFEIQQLMHCKKSIKEIMQIVDKHYREIFREEQEWLKTKGFTITVQEAEQTKTMIRIGKGSGLIGTSILMATKKFAEVSGMDNLLRKAEKLEPKTKWLARFKKKGETKFSYYPLGWAAIELQEKK